MKNKKLADKITLGRKTVVRKTKKDLKTIEDVVKLIHKKTTKRLSIDVPDDLYKEMKILIAKEDKTVREYFLELLQKDIESKL